MNLRMPTWMPRPDGGWSLVAPRYKDGEPITNFPCILGWVGPEGRGERFRWLKHELDPAWWPYPHWSFRGGVETGTAATVALAMQVVETGLTRERAERPALARSG